MGDVRYLWLLILATLYVGFVLGKWAAFFVLDAADAWRRLRGLERRRLK